MGIRIIHRPETWFQHKNFLFKGKQKFPTKVKLRQREQQEFCDMLCEIKVDSFWVFSRSCGKPNIESLHSKHASIFNCLRANKCVHCIDFIVHSDTCPCIAQRWELNIIDSPASQTPQKVLLCAFYLYFWRKIESLHVYRLCHPIAQILKGEGKQQLLDNLFQNEVWENVRVHCFASHDHSG